MSWILERAEDILRLINGREWLLYTLLGSLGVFEIFRHFIESVGDARVGLVIRGLSAC